MGAYKHSIQRPATQELQAIACTALLSRLVQRIQMLADQPRPAGVEKLAGWLAEAIIIATARETIG